MTLNNFKNWLKWDYLLLLGFFGTLSAMSILKYISLNSAFQDLGIFLWQFFNISQGEWWRTLIIHFQPFMFLLSYLYKIFPDQFVPYILLLIQAAFLSLPILGLYKKYGMIAAIAYSLFFPVWFNSLFDFHMDHFAVPILFGFFFYLKKNQVGIAVFMGILLALIKEPYALQTIFCGLFLILFYKKYLAGFLLIIIGFFVFFIFTQYVAPYFSIWKVHGMLETDAYAWLGKNPIEIIGFIFTNPYIIFQEIFSAYGKFYYLFWIFGSLAFIPLLKPKFLIVGLPVFGIALLSKNPNFYGIEFHYTAGLIAPLTIAFAEGLPKAKQIWGKFNLPWQGFVPAILVFLIFCNIWKSPSPISRIFWKPYGTYSYMSYKQTDREKMIKQLILEFIPADPKIKVSVQNTLNWEYLAHRKTLLVFPAGVSMPTLFPIGSDRTLLNLWESIRTGEFKKAEAEEHWADYVVLDLKRAWFIGDKGCVWKNQNCQDDPEFTAKYLDLVEHTKSIFTMLVEIDGFLILKRPKNPNFSITNAPGLNKL